MLLKVSFQNQTCKVMFTKNLKICGLNAADLFYISVRDWRNVSKLYETSKK